MISSDAGGLARMETGERDGIAGGNPIKPFKNVTLARVVETFEM
jgi:hypothetical protein